MSLSRTNRRPVHAKIATLAVLQLTLGCKPSRESQPPRSEDGALVLRFDAGALKGASCTLNVENLTGPSDGQIGSTTDFALALSTAGGELALQLQSVRSELVLGPVTLRTRVTPELVEEPTNEGGHIVRKAADDANARREIEAITGAPRMFIRLDQRGGILEYREQLATELKIPDLEGLGLAWMLGLPHLPAEGIREGAEWVGVRFLPNEANADPDRGTPISYRLLGVSRGIATIAIRHHTTAAIGGEGLLISGAVTIEGESRVRVADGRPLSTNVTATLTFGGSKGSGGWSWHYTGECPP